ncbi:unnamed protein product [Lota lota]
MAWRRGAEDHDTAQAPRLTTAVKKNPPVYSRLILRLWGSLALGPSRGGLLLALLSRRAEPHERSTP